MKLLVFALKLVIKSRKFNDSLQPNENQMFDFNIFTTEFEEKNWHNKMQILKLISRDQCWVQ